LESACAFILRAGSRTLSTWNSYACHPCIILIGEIKLATFQSLSPNPNPGSTSSIYASLPSSHHSLSF
jgi:hypothetical protein